MLGITRASYTEVEIYIYRILREKEISTIRIGPNGLPLESLFIDMYATIDKIFIL